MAKISLKNIIGKKNDTTTLVESFIARLNANVSIEDEKGKILWGQPQENPSKEEPVMIGDETIGWVKGDENTELVANLLSVLSQKEDDRKKLGSEVLNLYQEVNLIFNFSEKLTQTINPAAISEIALSEATHLIRSDNGVVVFWDEQAKRMQVMASTGELFFNED